MNKRGVAITLALVVSALALFGGLLSYKFTNLQFSPLVPMAVCNDSDGGLRFFDKGKTCEGKNCVYDSCFSGKVLNEYYCWEGKRMAQYQHTCETICQNGICMDDRSNECNDGKDNDGDGWVDFIEDAQCSDIRDDSEDVDSVMIAKSSDNLNLGDTMSGVFGNNVDDDDLPDLLTESTYLNDENTEFNYEQRITLYPRKLTFFADSDYKGKEPTIGFQIGSNTNVMNYSIDFPTDAESDVGSSGDLTDFETTGIDLMGKRYYISDAQNGTSSKYMGQFTLLDGSHEALLAENDIANIIIDDKSYKVSITFISQTQVRLQINGEYTNLLSQGDTYRLSDGAYVSIKDILYNSGGGTSYVDFVLSLIKVEIEAGSDIEFNDDSISGMKGYVFRGSPSSSKQKLDKIVIEWKTDDEDFITDSKYLIIPAFNSTGFYFNGFVINVSEETNVFPSGQSVMKMNTTIKDGSVNINLLYADANGLFRGIGRGPDQQLATSFNGTLMYNWSDGRGNGARWFVATYNTSVDAESYLLYATVAEKNRKNRTTIRNEVTGNEVCVDIAAGDNCTIGGVFLKVDEVHKDPSGIKWVRFTAGENTNFNTLYTKEGLNILLPFEINSSDNSGSGNNTRGQISFQPANSTSGHNASSYYLYFDEENKNNELAAGKSFNVTLGSDSTGSVHVRDIDAGTEVEIPNTSDDTIATVESDLATQVKKLVVNYLGQARISYHGTEAYGKLFLQETAPICSDGLDDDFDGLTDGHDPGCTDAWDSSE